MDMVAAVSSSRLRHVAGYAPAATLAVTLCVGVLVPVYTDEVAWRFQMSRLAQDGWLDRGLSESCGGASSVAPPPFMWPVRLFSSGWTALWPSPLAVRLAGVLCALAMLTLMLLLARRLYLRAGDRGGGLAAVLVPALLGLGVLPFLLVWSRPEQPVLLALLAALCVALAPRPRRPAPAVVAIACLAAVALSYAFKALFYLPLFAWALLVASGGGRRPWPALGLLAAALMGASAYRYWTARFACPGDPLVAARIARENAGAALMHEGWGERLRALGGLAPGMSPLRYLRLVRPQGPFMSDWLPAPMLGHGALKLWWVAVRIGWGAGAALGLAALVRALADPVARRERPALIWLALLCVACPSAWALLQRNVNAYEASLYLPVIAIGIAAALAAGGRWQRIGVVVATLVALLSLASQAALAATFAPGLWRAERGGGYVAGQPYSLSAFAWGSTRERIAATGRLCGIPPVPGRLLIDDLTYFAYAGGARPMHRLGVLSDWNGSIRDPLAWMRAHGSAGAVIRCAYLPSALRARARAIGDECCLAMP